MRWRREAMQEGQETFAGAWKELTRRGEDVYKRQMYNTQTGFDMRYQRNKVYNLKLAAAPLDGLIIGPGETFSFCQAVRHADRQVRYKEGLTVVDLSLIHI